MQQAVAKLVEQRERAIVETSDRRNLGTKRCEHVAGDSKSTRRRQIPRRQSRQRARLAG
jgi:hypothetical protein